VPSAAWGIWLIVVFVSVDHEDLFVKQLVVFDNLSFETLFEKIIDVIHFWKNIVADIVHEINFPLLDDKHAILNAIHDQLEGVLLIFQEVFFIQVLSIEALN
jgi:hypothetical protein